MSTIAASKLEKYDAANKTWVEHSPLALFDVTGFIGTEKLLNLHYHAETCSVHYSFGADKCHRAGRFFFTEDHRALVGTVAGDDLDSLTNVRGKLQDSVFTTERRKEGDTGAWTAFEMFSYGSEWVDGGKLKSH